MPLIDALRAFREFVLGVKLSNDCQPWNPNEYEYFFSRDDLTVSLSGNDGRSYQRCLRFLYDAVAPKQFLSRGTVERLANTMFANIVRKSMSCPRESLDFQFYFDEQFKELRKALEQTPRTLEVISRVCGIDGTGLPMKFGKVTFVVASTVTLESVPEEVITRGAGKERFDGNVVGRITVQAVDVDAARASANRLLQQTIDCLNFLSVAAGAKGQAYLLGEKESGVGLNISLGSDSVVTYHSFLFGPLQPLPLHAVAQQPGFAKISKMLDTDNISDLDDRILRATQWAGRALVDTRREESFLLMAIALESLMLKNQRDENISYKIALRCAHLIGLPNVEAKRKIVKDIRDLYGRRSAIVHSGLVEVSDSELASLHHYVKAALYVAINKEPFCSMKDESEFEGWFEERLLEAQNN